MIDTGKRKVVIEELDKLYKETGIKHDEIEAMKFRQISEIKKCPLIRKKLDLFERILGIHRTQMECMIDIVEANIKWLHEELEYSKRIKTQILEDFGGLRGN